MDLYELELKVAMLESECESKVFHSVIGELVEFLGFKKNKEFYEAYPLVGSAFSFETRLETLRMSRQFQFREYVSTIKHAKDNDFIFASTFSPTIDYFRDGLYTGKVIMSSSKFGLEKIIDFEDLTKRGFVEAGKPSPDYTFREGFVIRHSGMYFFHEDFLFKLVEKKIRCH